MKSKLIAFIAVFLILISFCLYQNAKKEDIYINFINLPGYRYQFIDSTNVFKTKKILITQNGKMRYQWWQVDVDTIGIQKTELTEVIKLIHNSQFWIISNYQQLGMSEKKLNKYRLHIIQWEKETPYVLPVKSVHIVTE